jgi:hypothetical protein
MTPSFRFPLRAGGTEWGRSPRLGFPSQTEGEPSGGVAWFPSQTEGEPSGGVA